MQLLKVKAVNARSDRSAQTGAEARVHLAFTKLDVAAPTRRVATLAHNGAAVNK